MSHKGTPPEPASGEKDTCGGSPLSQDGEGFPGELRPGQRDSSSPRGESKRDSSEVEGDSCQEAGHVDAAYTELELVWKKITTSTRVDLGVQKALKTDLRAVEFSPDKCYQVYLYRCCNARSCHHPVHRFQVCCCGDLFALVVRSHEMCDSYVLLIPDLMLTVSISSCLGTRFFDVNITSTILFRHVGPLSQLTSNSRRHVHSYLHLKLTRGPDYKVTVEDLDRYWRRLERRCPNGI